MGAAETAGQVRGYTGDWVDTLARLGYTAKGVVYTVVGVLAVQAAAGSGGGTTGSRGALEAIGDQPFGRILLGLTALGLLGYVVWRFTEAVGDPDDKGDDAEGIVKRLGMVVSGFIYSLLAIAAGRAALGMGSGSGDTSKQSLTAEVLSQPFGQWAVGLVGAIIVGVGLYHFYRAYKASFMRHYKDSEMSPKQKRIAKRLGQVGFSARGVTFCIIGGFVLQAAWQADPSETRGLGGALQTLLEQPYGPWLLSLVAVGLVAYGVYCFSRARYRRFETQ